MLIYNAKIDKSITANYYAVRTTSKKKPKIEIFLRHGTRTIRKLSARIFILLSPL